MQIIGDMPCPPPAVAKGTEAIIERYNREMQSLRDKYMTAFCSLLVESVEDTSLLKSALLGIITENALGKRDPKDIGVEVESILPPPPTPQLASLSMEDSRVDEQLYRVSLPSPREDLTIIPKSLQPTPIIEDIDSMGREDKNTHEDNIDILDRDKCKEWKDVDSHMAQYFCIDLDKELDDIVFPDIRPSSLHPPPNLPRITPKQEERGGSDMSFSFGKIEAGEREERADWVLGDAERGECGEESGSGVGQKSGNGQSSQNSFSTITEMRVPVVKVSKKCVKTWTSSVITRDETYDPSTSSSSIAIPVRPLISEEEEESKTNFSKRANAITTRATTSSRQDAQNQASTIKPKPKPAQVEHSKPEETLTELDSSNQPSSQSNPNPPSEDSHPLILAIPTKFIQSTLADSSRIPVTILDTTLNSSRMLIARDTKRSKFLNILDTGGFLVKQRLFKSQESSLEKRGKFQRLTGGPSSSKQAKVDPASNQFPIAVCFPYAAGRVLIDRNTYVEYSFGNKQVSVVHKQLKVDMTSFEHIYRDSYQMFFGFLESCSDALQDSPNSPLIMRSKDNQIFICNQGKVFNSSAGCEYRFSKMHDLKLTPAANITDFDLTKYNSGYLMVILNDKAHSLSIEFSSRTSPISKDLQSNYKHAETLEFLINYEKVLIVDSKTILVAATRRRYGAYEKKGDGGGASGVGPNRRETEENSIISIKSSVVSDDISVTDRSNSRSHDIKTKLESYFINPNFSKTTRAQANSALNTSSERLNSSTTAKPPSKTAFPVPAQPTPQKPSKPSPPKPSQAPHQQLNQRHEEETEEVYYDILVYQFVNHTLRFKSKISSRMLPCPSNLRSKIFSEEDEVEDEDSRTRSKEFRVWSRPKIDMFAKLYVEGAACNDRNGSSEKSEESSGDQDDDISEDSKLNSSRANKGRLLC